MTDAQPWLDQLLEAWRTNCRINLFLIDYISDEGMLCTLSKRGGRNVVRQFCHLHNVRLVQLEARAKDLSKDLYKFETEEEPDTPPSAPTSNKRVGGRVPKQCVLLRQSGILEPQLWVILRPVEILAETLGQLHVAVSFLVAA